MANSITAAAAVRILTTAAVVVVQVWGGAAAPGAAVPLATALAAARARGAAISYWPAQVDPEGRAYPATVTIVTGCDELRYTVALPEV